MIFSIVKQSIDIRMGFENPPKLTSDTECAAVIGMLAKACGLPVPDRKADFFMMRRDLEMQRKDIPVTDQIEKLGQLLSAYEPKTAVDDEKYELLKYSYDHTEKN